MEIGYAAALGVPIVVLTTDFQTYGTSEHGAALHFPDVLIQTVVTEIVHMDHLVPPGDGVTRFETFRDRNLGQLATGVSLAIERVVDHARSSSERKPAVPRVGPFAVCEPSPHYTDDAWVQIIQMLGNRGYRVHQSQRFGAANPLAEASRDWKGAARSRTPRGRHHRSRNAVWRRGDDRRRDNSCSADHRLAPDTVMDLRARSRTARS